VDHFLEDSRNAYEARCEAQRIAFAPMVFQACRLLRKHGLLEQVHASGAAGLTLEEITSSVSLPAYGVRLLMEAALGIGVFRHKEGRFMLNKLGYFLLHDPMTHANMDMVHHICYRGLYHLDESLEQGRPAGLKTLGDWKTLYEGLLALSEEARQSWLTFDHYYSDQAFAEALPYVFADHPKRILDVGGNTGDWAARCLQFDPELRMTIVDLPAQINAARENLRQRGLAGRAEFLDIDLLDESRALPGGYDVICMSQFLDCFSPGQIVSILSRAARALDRHGTLHILELFWDRQPNETAAFCLQQTSLYFACIANGNSRMYKSSELLECIEQSGLAVLEQRDRVGQYHTWLKCRPA
jgi:ubiquinone/menaquinone biosynthesis C-methylase UbiE